jgi:hypothetical protein
MQPTHEWQLIHHAVVPPPQDRSVRTVYDGGCGGRWPASRDCWRCWWPVWQPPEDRDYRSPYLAQVTSRYVDTPVARFHYTKTGHGPAVVLLPGGTLWIYSYREIIPELAKHFTVVTVDLPGQGYGAWAPCVPPPWCCGATRTDSTNPGRPTSSAAVSPGDRADPARLWVGPQGRNPSRARVGPVGPIEAGCHYHLRPPVGPAGLCRTPPCMAPPDDDPIRWRP